MKKCFIAFSLLVLWLVCLPGCSEKPVAETGQPATAVSPTPAPQPASPAEIPTQVSGSAINAIAKPTPPPAPEPEKAVEPEKPALDDATALQVEKLDQEIVALKAIKEGTLPSGFTLRDLFPIDLTNQEAVDKWIQELKNEIEKIENAMGITEKKSPPKSSKVKAEEKVGESNTVEQPVHPEIQKRKLEAAKLRLEFLKQPLEKHSQILELEAKRKQEEQKAQIDHLNKEIEALQLVLDGRLPEDFELRMLFEVDPKDETAVKARVEALKTHIESQSEKLTQKAPEPKTESALKDQEPKEDKAAKEEEKEKKDKSKPPKKEEKQEEKAAQEKPLEDLGKTLATLQLHRDKLRLDFFQLPPEKRTAILDAEDKRIRIAQEKAAAEQARLEAELAERKAEQARQKALEEERLAVTSAEKAIAKERARTEQARGALAGLRLQLSELRQKNAETAGQVLQQQDGYRKRITAGLKRKEADVLYNEIVHTLTGARKQLQEALDLLNAPSTIPPFKPEIALDDPRFEKVSQNQEELKTALHEVIAETDVLIAEEKASRWNHTSELADDVKLLNDLRLELIPMLTSKKRRAVLGFGREGIAQMFREIDQIRLATRFYLFQGSYRIKEIQDKFQDVFTLGAVGFTFLKILLLVGFFFFLGKNFQNLVQRVRNSLLAGTKDRDLRLFLDRWLNFAIGIAPSFGWLIFVYLFFFLISGNQIREVSVLRLFVLAYVWYRACLAVSLYYITGSVRSRRISVSAELKNRIMRSVQIVLRYIFPVFVFLAISDRVLGHGYLYQLVVRFFWIGAIPITVYLLRHWRPEIAQNYHDHYPDTKLAEKIKEAKKGKPNLIVTFVAFLFVTGRWLRLSLSDTLSRFRGTRKAFSYLFRRQLEKQAETIGHAGSNIEALPQDLQEACSEEPPFPEYAIDFFPHLDKMKKQLADWKETGHGSAVALVGESGVGRTTWLNEVERRDPLLNPIRAEIDQGANTPEEVCEVLSRILGMPNKCGVEELIEKIRSGPPRLIILDQCQNMVFRAVGGMIGFTAFAEIIGRTTPHMFWICAFSSYAWQYAQSVFSTDNVFHTVYPLKAWDEESIRKLINKRMAMAGYRVSYEDLIVDRVDGTAFENEVIRTGERYRQLLWDYSDGIPRVALHFWLRSLVPDGEKRVKVRLFSAPSADELEGLNEPTRFVLAALVIHQNLTIEEAAQVLNYKIGDCELILDSLSDRNFVHERNSRFYISAHWQRAIIRYLRRKHLLYT